MQGTISLVHASSDSTPAVDKLGAAVLAPMEAEGEPSALVANELARTGCVRRYSTTYTIAFREVSAKHEQQGTSSVQQCMRRSPSTVRMRWRQWPRRERHPFVGLTASRGWRAISEAKVRASAMATVSTLHASAERGCQPAVFSRLELLRSSASAARANGAGAVAMWCVVATPRSTVARGRRTGCKQEATGQLGASGHWLCPFAGCGSQGGARLRWIPRPLRRSCSTCGARPRYAAAGARSLVSLPSRAPLRLLLAWSGGDHVHLPWRRFGDGSAIRASWRRRTTRE